MHDDKDITTKVSKSVHNQDIGSRKVNVTEFVVDINGNRGRT